MNWFKDTLETKPAVYGMWLATGSHIVAEIAAAAGYDWGLVDYEHGMGSDDDLLRYLQVLGRTATSAVVRVPRWDSPLIQRALDQGASAIMAPMIRTAGEAAAFIRAMRYSPDGTRGLTSATRAADFGRTFPDYFKVANQRLTGIIQIETVESVANADAIAAIDGVDVLFIGHSDLTLSLGCFQQYKHPSVVAAEAAVLAACTKHGKQAGMLLRATTPIADYRARGFSVFALATDIGAIRESFSRTLDAAKEA